MMIRKCLTVAAMMLGLTIPCLTAHAAVVRDGMGGRVIGYSAPLSSNYGRTYRGSYTRTWGGGTRQYFDYGGYAPIKRAPQPAQTPAPYRTPNPNLLPR